MEPNEIYQYKVTLNEITPTIWRRILVPDTLTLAQLHKVLVIVLGWQNSHIHIFKVGEHEYAEPSDDWDDEIPMKNHKKMTLGEIYDSGFKEFNWTYDLGDSWNHTLTLEKALEPDEVFNYPICIGGERACPPEDCGGTGGYERFIEAISNKDNEEHNSMRMWAGGFFNPETFDPNRVNRELWKIR